MSNKISEIVDEIQFRHKLTQEQIAKRIGYSRPYFTDAVKKGTSKKLISALSKEFPETVQKDTYVSNVQIDPLISELVERLIRAEATSDVSSSLLAALYAERKGANVAKERLEIDKVCEEQYDFFFSELKRKRKQEA